MGKRPWSGTTRLLCMLFALVAWPLLTLSAEQTKEEAATPREGKVPEEYAVTITGRVLSEEKQPLVRMNIIVSETHPDKIMITWRTGDDGKFLNPSGYTDTNGRFTILADRRFWEKTGYFTLQGGFIPGTMQNTGILRGVGGGPVLIKTDPKTKKFDIGDITVSRQ